MTRKNANFITFNWKFLNTKLEVVFFFCTFVLYVCSSFKLIFSFTLSRLTVFSVKVSIA